MGLTDCFFTLLYEILSRTLFDFLPFLFITEYYGSAKKIDDFLQFDSIIHEDPIQRDENKLELELAKVSEKENCNDSIKLHTLLRKKEL